MKTFFKTIGLLFLIVIIGLGAYFLSAPVPKHRAERVFFGMILPVFQKLKGLPYKPGDHSRLYGFKFESPDALALLRDRYRLNDVVAEASTDFESSVQLMHWVRDQFPHRVPAVTPPPQAFNGATLLEDYERRGRHGGFLCGTASQLLVQAVTALGGFARRVELRFIPGDAHAVVEVWSETYQKWIVLDPDYDLYYTVNDIPQNAIELHRLWVAGMIDPVEVHWRDSPHNIYQPQDKIDYRRHDRFAVKLLNYYSFISYPLRNDWVSRPLPWWHPEGNHVQNSLVLETDGMRKDEDFLRYGQNWEAFYAPPNR